MNAITLLTALAVNTGSPAVREASHAAVQTNCTAETEQSRRLAVRLSTDGDYANARVRLGMAASAATDVRLLTDAADAATCQNLYSQVQQQIQSSGGSLSGWTVVFYQAGSVYLAVLTVPPPDPTAPAGYGHVRGGYVPVYAFNSALGLVGLVGM